MQTEECPLNITKLSRFKGRLIMQLHFVLGFSQLLLWIDLKMLHFSDEIIYLQIHITKKKIKKTKPLGMD